MNNLWYNLWVFFPRTAHVNSLSPVKAVLAILKYRKRNPISAHFGGELPGDDALLQALIWYFLALPPCSSLHLYSAISLALPLWEDYLTTPPSCTSEFQLFLRVPTFKNFSIGRALPVKGTIASWDQLGPHSWNISQQCGRRIAQGSG